MHEQNMPIEHRSRKSEWQVTIELEKLSYISYLI